MRAKLLQLCLTLCDRMDSHITSSPTPKFTVLALVVTSAWNIFPPDLHLANIYHLDFNSSIIREAFTNHL